jgi:transposase-like protein
MAVRDIAAQLGELYGVDISRDTISRVTDAVLEDVAEWLAAARMGGSRSSVHLL